MAYKEMDVAPTLNVKDKIAYEATDSKAAAGEGVSILVPPGVIAITVQVSMSGGGTCKVQTTIDPVYTVKTGSPTWVDWDKGEVASAAQGICSPVTAIRLYQIHAGATAISLRAQ